jgi:uncharacterized membrane protein
MIARSLRHLFAMPWRTRRRFPPDALGAIETAIREVEARHAGEIRVAIETSLDLPELFRGLTPRERALEIFGLLGVWNTEDNNGVLLYVLMADRDVEIVADRGIAARVPVAEWEAICRHIETAFRAQRFGPGVIDGVRAIGELLARHFPHARGDRNELPDRPVML